MKKNTVLIVALFCAPLLYSISQHDILGKITGLSATLIGGGILESKKVLSAPNASLDNLYQLATSTKTYVKEKKTAIQSIKGVFGKEDPALTVANTLETLTINLINTIKIIRGIQTPTERTKQGTVFTEIINKTNSLITTINTLPKTEVSAVLTRMTDFIKRLAETAKKELA